MSRARIARGDSQLTSESVYLQIANALKVSTADVRNMDARLAAADVSLQAPVAVGGETGTSHIDLLASEAPLPDEEVTEMIDGERRREWLRRALTRLNEREMKIIRARRLTDSSSTLEERLVAVAIAAVATMALDAPHEDTGIPGMGDRLEG